jgi:arylsulfatase B
MLVRLVAIVGMLAFGACSEPPTSEPGPTTATDAGGGTAPTARPNILLVIADDLGADVAPCMASDSNRLPMAGVEALCAKGVVFNTTWSNPTCSPTRATMLTGRYSFRTGIGQQLLGNGSQALSLQETTLPQLLKSDFGVAYASAAFGKWHLANSSNGGDAHPNSSGFDAYAGLMIGAHRDYYSWARTENGQTQTVDDYSTTRIADDAISWLGEQDKPWFLWLAFTAPHTPFHAPPSHLHAQTGLVGTTDHINSNRSRYYAAAAEALDREMSRVFQAIGESQLDNTWIIFVGDNGTPGQVIPAPGTRRRAKGTLYEGGIHVPMVIAGPGISAPGRSVETPVNLADLFATIGDMAGRDSATMNADRLVDSVSLMPYLLAADAAPQRQWAYSEIFGPDIDTASEGRTARDARYKLIRFDNGERALYDLENDPGEADDLLRRDLGSAEQAAYDELDATIIDLSGRP